MIQVFDDLREKKQQQIKKLSEKKECTFIIVVWMDLSFDIKNNAVLHYRIFWRISGINFDVTSNLIPGFIMKKSRSSRQAISVSQYSATASVAAHPYNYVSRKFYNDLVERIVEACGLLPDAGNR